MQLWSSNRSFPAQLLSFIGVAALLIAIAPMVSVAGSPPETRAAGLHGGWTKILAANVRNEQVDYTQIKSSHASVLRDYLDSLASIDPATLGRDARLAFFINLYNATTVSAVIDRYRAGYSPSENDFAIFSEELVRTSDGRISLNALENEIIRPQFGEPRIHVALVCGAESCPPLVPRAYTAQNLDATLESNMKRFLTDGRRNKIDQATQSLELSKLFEWYAEDFGGASGVVDYVNAYTDIDVAGWSVRFQEYSWELNDTP